MIPDHKLEERRGPQERDINEDVLGIEEGHSWPPRNLRSIQEAALLPGHTTQNRAALNPHPSQSGPIMSRLKEMGYSVAELDGILARFGAEFNAVIDRALLLKPSPAISQAQNDRSEYQVSPIQASQAQAPKLRSNALKIIHKQVLLSLLRRSSLQEFKPLVLEVAGRIYLPGLENLRNVEDLLLSYALVSFDLAQR